MDGSSLEHSDSDSGESWTVLDSAPAHADNAPEFKENLQSSARDEVESLEKDEDTDGISIISDSDPDTSSPCELTYDNYLAQENRPVENKSPQYIPIDPLPTNRNDSPKGSIRSTDDFLGSNTGKLKTYVHKRNKRLSTMLNIIVLGSVITAAGVAIGHMWGVKDDCSMHTTPSVNKILSNLYKLQEENAYLRNKIKELTVMNNNIQIKHRKAENSRFLSKPRCKKVFEASLQSINPDKITKCVDDENDNIAISLLENSLHQPQPEKDFISNIEKLKPVYEQNKRWLDEEVTQRLKHEVNLDKSKPVSIQTKFIEMNKGHKNFKNENLQRLLESIVELPVNKKSIVNVTETPEVRSSRFDDVKDFLPEKRVTYADSLKSYDFKNINKRETNTQNNENRKTNPRKKPIKDNDLLSTSDDEQIKKDDRNTHKSKQGRKKHDHNKINKKIKRKYKYKQWELKDSLKEFDGVSTSSQENAYILKHVEENTQTGDFDRKNNVKQLSKSDNKLYKLVEEVEDKNDLKKQNDDIGSNWYDKRAALRKEARKKLELELFGESPNTGGWYFRRMHKREQCRIKGDNSTYKKLSKRYMNFKMKH